MESKLLSLIVLTCSVLLAGVGALAGTVNLPQTGQTTCYDGDGGATICTGTGQDANIKAGVAWPIPRFNDNGDGTITDNLTGLMWLKNANYFGSRSWSTALGDCINLNIAGYTDWQLPNINELVSLVVNGEFSNPGWLSSHGFDNVQSANYWSSTTHMGNTNTAWGAGSMVFGLTKTGTYHVWPVRSVTVGGASVAVWQTTCYDQDGNSINCAGAGQDGELRSGVAWPSPRFTDHGDSTITDNLTGLMWLKNADYWGGFYLD